MGYYWLSPDGAFRAGLCDEQELSTNVPGGRAELQHLAQSRELHSILVFGSYKLPGHRGICRPPFAGLTITVEGWERPCWWERTLLLPLRNTMGGVSGKGGTTSK